MDLYLLRHGDAVDRLTGGHPRDETRPLTEKGRAEARAAALALRGLGIAIDRILTSPLVRAEQTAHLASELLRPARGLARCGALAPGGTPEEIVAALTVAPDGAILLVGHMPDLGELAGWLLWGDTLAAIPFRTGGLCRITVPAPPTPGQGDLRWLAPPKLLRKLG